MPCTKQTDEIILELPNAIYQTNVCNYFGLTTCHVSNKPMELLYFEITKCHVSNKPMKVFWNYQMPCIKQTHEINVFWNYQKPCIKQTHEIILEMPNAMYQTNR
jgi:hypothetical protein